MSVATKVEPAASDLAEMMLADDETMREVISETLDSAAEGQITESGRTICNGRDIHGPMERHPTSVALYPCPYDRGGAWHSHVTPDEIKEPRLSLTDVAQVVFGNLDVMIVAGTRTAEAAVRPSDPEAALKDFRDSLGVDVEDPRDVTDAVYDGGVDPVAAGDEFRRKRPSMFKREDTGYGDLDERAAEVVDWSVREQLVGGQEAVDARVQAMYSGGFSSPGSTDGPFGDLEREFGQMCDDVASVAPGQSGSPVDIKAIAISNAVGSVVGNLVNRIIFGS